MLTLLTIVRNEEERLPGMLNSLLNDEGQPICDQLVLIDQDSSDRTCDVARAWAEALQLDHVIQQADEVGYSELSRNQAVPLCTGRWILHLDPDEALSLPLRNVLPTYTGTPGLIRGFYLRRLSRVLLNGEVMEEQWEGNQLRLVQQPVPIQSTDLHTTWKVAGPVGTIPEHMTHDKTVDEVIADQERYQEIKPWEPQEQLLARMLAYKEGRDVG